MKNNLRRLAGMAILLLVSCASGPPVQQAPKVVHGVDLARYAGRWYEIASFPQWFQRGCVDSRADYRLLDDGSVEVINSCLREGSVSRAEGRAWVSDPETRAKLKVSFFWPFRGDYWILELGKDYEFAVVSAPDRKYLWILSRSPRMAETEYEAILGRLKEQGFDIGRLERTYRGMRTDP